MKKKYQFLFVLLSVVLITSIFFGCAEKNLLLGKWATASGDEITFEADKSFKLAIKTDTGTDEMTGTYSTNANIVTFNVIVPSQKKVVSQFGFNGGILEILWASEPSDKPELKEFYLIQQ